jgi:hypothetical protein
MKQLQLLRVSLGEKLGTLLPERELMRPTIGTALKEFASHPKLEAKWQYKTWCKGFHIVISEIIKFYGDDVLKHFTPNQRKHR